MARKYRKAAAIEARVARQQRERRYHLIYVCRGETVDDALDAYGLDHIDEEIDVVFIGWIAETRDTIDDAAAWPRWMAEDDVHAPLHRRKDGGRTAPAAEANAALDETTPN